MLSDARCAKAAALLAAHWRDGTHIPHLPPELRPTTRADGYRVQTCIAEMSPGGVAGWKIAATSKAGQAHINVAGPLAGRILTERLVENGARVSLAGNNMRVAELEFAFRLGVDLAPRPDGYGNGEIRAAVAALHPAVELPASCYEDFCVVGEAALIADNACAHLFLIGPAIEPDTWRKADLVAQRVFAHVEGRGSFKGIGRNVLGDPWAALGWLVNECSGLGIGLSKGQVVSTGTCLVPVAVEPGDSLVAEFGMGEGLRLSFR